MYRYKCTYVKWSRHQDPWRGSAEGKKERHFQWRLHKEIPKKSQLRQANGNSLVCIPIFSTDAPLG